ncbi:MAG: CHAT domain-containing protein [Elainellaceae cyanobacterium]
MVSRTDGLTWLAASGWGWYVALQVLSGQALWASPAAAATPARFNAVKQDAALNHAEQQFEAGQAYYRDRQFSAALTAYQQALTDWIASDHQPDIAQAHYEIGRTLRNLEDYPGAIDAFQQALALFQALGDRQGQGEAINGIGQVYQNVGQVAEALAAFQQALALFDEMGDRLSQGYGLNNIGLIYRDRGDYGQALAFFQQAAARLTADDPRTSLYVLNNIGTLYAYLGQHERALATYQQALARSRDIDDRAGEATALHNVGFAYRNQAQYGRALTHYQQALAIRQDLGDRSGVAETLNNLGALYNILGDHEQAIAVLQQALSIHRQLGDVMGEGLAQDTLATAYRDQGETQRALETYFDALTTLQPVGNRRAEIIARSNLGQLLEQQGQTGLAIVFYKQAINLIEETRQGIRPLPRADQDIYTSTVANTYRQLAGLLLQQERVPEAHQVLDLLKVQELDNSLEGVRGEAGERQLPLRKPEAEVLRASQQHLDRAIAIANELRELLQKDGQDRSEGQNQRIVELEQLQSQLIQQFLDFVDSPAVQQQLAQLSQTAQHQDLLTELDRFPNLQDNLADIGHTALLYPLILEDRLELVLVTAHGPLVHYTVPVSRTDLVQTIFEFQQTLKDPSSDPEPLAQTLYRWLVEPVSDAIEAMDVQTLLYAPDGPLRYIPLAALHDGTGWLAQRYQVNQITAASLMDLNLRPSPAPSVLAGAFSQGHFQVSVLDRILEFSGLPNAGIEVDSLSEMFPTRSFFNLDFSRSAVAPLFNDYTIVHLATHAALLVDSPLDSFIMFGDGDRLTLAELRSWRGRLRSVDLIVLSACETGTGSILDANGEEILGFGYLMQDAGARAVIASLWPVSDGGTRELMTNLYTALLTDGMTKAKALQQAQIALITSTQIEVGAERGFSLVPRLPVADGLSNTQLSHPYYWAPFILIGNGL